MARVFEYFVVCGIGPEIRTLDGSKGYHGPEYYYLSSVLDQFPPLNHSLYPPPPPQLSTVSVSLFFFSSVFHKTSKTFFKNSFLFFSVPPSVFFPLASSSILQVSIPKTPVHSPGPIRSF